MHTTPQAPTSAGGSGAGGTTPQAPTTAGDSGAGGSSERAETAALLRARFAALHVAEAQRSLVARERWRHESEVLRNQISAMEETIGLLEREIKLVAAMVAKAEKAEAAATAASGGMLPMPATSRSAGGSSSSADSELLLGQLEDKCLRTQYDLEEARRQFYFPAVSGYTLRLSYGDTYVGFKELVLEQLAGTLRLTVAAGTTEDGHTQVPSIRLTFEGGSDDSGAALRFLGEGVSVVNRRELFGISLSPNVSFTRLDLAARFKADIPLVYLPKRRTWIVDSGFKIELLHFKREASATSGGEAEYAPEKLLRMLVQAVVEGITRQLLMGQLGPHLGAYLKDAAHGAELVLEVSVSGIPVRTFDAPLGGASEASAHAARLLGLSRAQVAQLIAVQRMVALDALPASENGALANGIALSASGSLAAAAVSPSRNAGAATGAGSAALPFVSLAEAMRHFSGARRVEPLRSELVALWQEALYSLRSEEQPADIELLLERIESLRRKPAQVTLRCVHLRLGVEPEKMLAAATGAVADQLFAISARHGTASAALHTFTEDALSYLAAARATLQRASLSLAGVLRGGGDGRFWLSVPHALYEGGALVSRLMSPAQATPFSVLSSMRDDGRLELLVSLPARRGGADSQHEGQSAPEADALVSTAAAPSAQPASSQAPPLEARAEVEVLRVLVTKAAASLLVDSSEVVRASFIPEPTHSPPRPPPLKLPPLNLHPRGARESRGARPGPVSDRLRVADVVVGEAASSTSVAYCSNASLSSGGAHGQRRAGATACRAECSSSAFIISPPARAGVAGRWVDGGIRAVQEGQPHQPLVRTVEAYENERRLTVLRSYSAQDLFPLDYAHFSDEAGKQRWASLANVALPGDGWRWVSLWRADMDGGTKNEQGWQFAIHFNTGWLGSSNPLTHVRRRRWVRCAELTPAPRPASPELEASRPIEAEAASGLDLGEPEGGWTIVDAADVGGVAARGFGAAAPRPVDESWVSDRARCDPPTPRAEGRDSSRGHASPAAALLQLSIADGASIRVTLEGVELSGRPVLLAEQVAAALLEQNLAAHTWFREPLMVALERMKKYLHSPKLHCQGALSISAASAGDGGSFAVLVEGTGREDSGDGAAAQQESGRRHCVLVFRNEINLMDFVSDVHDIYEAFTATVTTQSGYTAFDG